jgi:hypothetical protein
MQDKNTMAPLQIPKNLNFKPIFPISSLEMKVVHYFLANMLVHFKDISSNIILSNSIKFENLSKQISQKKLKLYDGLKKF